jgi:uncharacterized protein (TIGR03435 family)
MPKDHFDVMVTKPGSNELLKDELKKRFGLSAHEETRETDVLVLKVQNPNPPNLKRHIGDSSDTSWIGGREKVTLRNMSPGGFLYSIEGQLGGPVIDETGLTGRYDLIMEWRPRLGETENDAFKRALSEQLGLELVPERQSIGMLVVDEAK